MRRLLASTALAAILSGAAGIAGAQAQQGCGQGPIDANADGVVDADERQAFQLGVYSGTDFDGDGVVSRSEYCVDLSAIEPAAGPETTVILLEPMPHDAGARALIDHFESFDGNDDERISREEWTGVGDDEHAGAGLAGAYFDSVDTNLDGHVTLDEFAAARGVPYDRVVRQLDAG